MSDLSFESLNRKFESGDPSTANALSIYAGHWKFGFDTIAFAAAWDAIMRDPRPQWCAETFPDFHRLRIAELGPADGYNTAALEYRGASQLTAIEGNADSFMRCLILKNHLSLRATFLLGDFTRHFARPDVAYDLVYASGVLYHLVDPLRFLHDVSTRTRHLYLWTHVHDTACVDLIETERQAFAEGRVETATVEGVTARYFHRRYDLQHVASAGYIGGLGETSVWLSRDDLFGALDAYGFDVLKVVDDPYRDGGGMMPAVNILATRRGAGA